MGWFLLLPYFIFHLFLLLLHFPSYTYSLCNYHDNSALIQFKNSFVVNSSDDQPFTFQRDDGLSPCSSFSSKTESWKNGTDCCKWDGVTCDDAVSGRVIGLDLTCGHLRGEFHPNNTIFQLKHLQQLNLAYNHFTGSLLYSGIGGLLKLTHLNLSFSGISGDIPSTISHLSKLESLDLSNFEMRFDPSTWKKLILNTSNLRELHLDHVNMSSIRENSLSLLNNFSSSLVSLHLEDTGLQGKLPSNILCLPSLEELVLSWNVELRGQLPKSNWSTTLRYLDLYETSFSGEIPDSIGHLKSLEKLVLFGSNFNGMIPLSFSNLTQLTYLSLGANQFHGEISSLLSILDPSLLWLDLGDNQFTGSIGEFSTNSLNYLSLSTIKLQGKFPDSIFEFENLTYLDLSSTQLSGPVDFHQFSKLESLKYLDLSHNSFLLINSSVEHLLPNLESLFLSSCNITGSFPKFLAQFQNLIELDLSNNNIYGKIPKGFHEKLHSWNNIFKIDLRHNKLQGDLPIPPYGIVYFLLSDNNFIGGISSTICDASSINILDLAHNNLTGTIPQCLGNATYINYEINLAHNNLIGMIPQGLCNASHIIYIDLAHNNLTGTIPQCLCNASSLNMLSLAHNNLTGTIPQCLGSFHDLVVLDLQMNNLHGSIPRNFSKRNDFETIKLNGNRLDGPLPQALAQCTKLEVLDLGDNNIEDSFPSWLETLQELKVLRLRSNKLRGIITCPNSKHSFPKLRILDVANNNFSGSLPASCFMNFQAMKNVDDNRTGSLYVGSSNLYVSFGYYYNDSVMVVMKGQYRELVRILTTYTILDLSNNMFEGEVPMVIGQLNSLKGLNLSHNGINGTIPHSLSNLRNLEWLDLSRNRLTGEIPWKMRNLHFLSLLNLSQNHLEGIIPTGGQFDTFENSSYGENPMLCGLPLSKSCNKDEEQPPHSTFQDDEESGFGWKSVAVGYACGAVVGMLLAYNLFLTAKPQWLASLVEGVFGIRVKRTNNRARANRRGMN
ncbi:receptor-like protein 7 [Lotus japonicus]|uniref:receptor-like protein 7 n=1 Tax=Lotus japonicus TaxID=34305 RepID=UPI002582D682|nr:receptor-like protein 7 [Lotus japonicus]